MKTFLDKFNNLIVIFSLIIVSCNSTYTNINEKVMIFFDNYIDCIDIHATKTNSHPSICVNKIYDNFKVLKTYNLENSVEYLIMKEHISEFLVNSEIHQSILILKNKNQIYNIEGDPMLDSSGKLNKSFFELDAFKVRKIKEFSDNFYFIVKEYNAD